MASFQQSNSSDTAVAPAKKITAKSESQELGKDNRSRICIVITNPSVKDAWIALGPKAVSEEGIYLKKEGGSFVCDFYTGPISVVGEGNISYSEI